MTNFYVIFIKSLIRRNIHIVCNFQLHVLILQSLFLTLLPDYVYNYLHMQMQIHESLQIYITVQYNVHKNDDARFTRLYHDL